MIHDFRCGQKDQDKNNSVKMIAWIFRHLTVVLAVNMTYGLEYSWKCAPNIVINILCEKPNSSGFCLSSAQGGGKGRMQSPAMQAVMKQATLAATRALMPQFAMSARLSGAMAAGNAATCVRKEEHGKNLNSNSRLSVVWLSELQIK